MAAFFSKVSHILLSLLVVFAGISVKAGVSNCEERPDFISDLNTEIANGFEALPRMMLVAHEAEVYVEAKNSTYRFHGVQSFLPDKSKKLKSQIECATEVELGKEFFAYQLPTVIDVGSNKARGIWQIQVVSDAKKFGFWSQRSRFLSVSRTANEFLTSHGGSFKLYQISHDQYEMQLIKENDKFIETLSVTFDSQKNQD